MTEASTVVPCGSLQFENGFAETGNGAQHGLDLPETWMRAGVGAKGELRFAVPVSFTNDDTDAGCSSGTSDVVAGYKQQLGPARGFDVSLIPSLSFPTGSSRISSHGYDPTLQLPWSRGLAKHWTVAGMFSVAWPTQRSGRHVTGQGRFYFDRQMTTLIDAWMEYSGSFPQRRVPEHTLNMGACMKPTPHRQIDLHASFGLSAASPNDSIGLGYSVRFQIDRRR
jgi:Putative MetA-pathway of phenol degradation